MGKAKLGPSETDFLPNRSETLHESFREKMRQKGVHRGRKGHARSEIQFLSMVHGPHPEVEHLNGRFIPGSPKLKTTLDVLGVRPASDGIPPRVASQLTDLFPNLRRHRCCGGNDIQTTLFRRQSRPGCALPPTNHGTDLCHLLEHVAIDLVATISRAPSCSGITCGHRDPLHRFDLFLECEDQRVGAAAVRCAAHILLDILCKGEPPPGARRYGETARYFLGRPRSVLNPGDVLADLQGDPAQLEEALRFLAATGFLVEQRFSFDFSGAVVYRYRLAGEVVPLSSSPS